MKDGFLECVDVDSTIFSDIAGDQSFDGFDSYFSPAVAVGECYRAEAVVYPPLMQELPGGLGHELRTTIRGEFVGDAVGGEGVS